LLASCALCASWDLRCPHRSSVAARAPLVRNTSIFTYRDERNLFALIGIIIIAAFLALLQINAQRSGTTSPIAAIAGSTAFFAQGAVTALSRGVRNAAVAVVTFPAVAGDNARLRGRNLQLERQNVTLRQLVTAGTSQRALQPAIDLYDGLEARVIGFPPENESRAVTIDKGSAAGVRRDDGVLAGTGVVGRVDSVTPLTSTVLLVTDYTSRIPAIVRRGGWWGIARGNLTSVTVEYVEQDAPLRNGDVVVTGEGRSFHSGIPIGTITNVQRGSSLLYQTAVLAPAVDLGALDRVVVLTK
jgi:rod shape-determining protein MreC